MSSEQYKILKNLSGKKTKYTITKPSKVESPKVSVILPVYNVEKYIQECMDSLLNQTLQDIEIIFVNDETKDNSFEIVKNHAANDDRFALITQKNYGAGVARNAGLSIAKGKYLYFMDSDDVLLPNALQKLYEEAEANNLDIVIFNCYYWDNVTKEKDIKPWSLKEEYFPQEKIFSYREYAKYIYNCTPNWAWNKLFNRDFIQKNNLIFQDSAHTNDTYFTCIALALAERMSILNNPLLLYRVNQKNSLTSQSVRNKKPLDILKVMGAIQNKLIEIDRYDYLKQSFLNLLLAQFHFNLSKTSGFSRKLLLFNIRYFGIKKFNMSNISENELYDDPYILTLQQIKKYSILQEIFSLTNSKDKRYKIITIFGIKIKLKKKRA